MANKTNSTERNKGLEPLPLGKIGLIGYVREIHEDDAMEFEYKLPLGSIKRLIKSYLDSIKDADEENVYLAQSSSMGSRERAYSFRMINDLMKCLNKHGLGGQKIYDDVFNQYFKKDYEKLEKYSHNHPEGMYDFKICTDPECCNYSQNLFYKFKVFLKIVVLAFNSCRTMVPVKQKPHITWH